MKARRATVRAIAAGFLALLACLCACTRQAAESTAQPKQSAATAVEKGPVRLSVRTDRSEAVVGERIALTIEAIAESGVEVTIPSVGAQLGDFEVTEIERPPDIPVDGKRQWLLQCTLRTLESGAQEVPGLTVKFTDRRNAAPDAQIQQSELTSEPLTINIQSLIVGEFDPAKFRDIRGEFEDPLPCSARPLFWIIAGLAVAAALVFGWLKLRRHTPAIAPAAPPLPPHVWALQQLDVLAAAKLAERGEFHEFFFRLSAIVRQYIERRFAIMASEQTTEEFLRESQHHAALNDAHRVLLSTFLRHADMVKFAKLQPGANDSETALESARHFVDETKADDAAFNDTSGPSRERARSYFPAASTSA